MMDELVARVAAAAGISAEQAARAIDLIFAFLKKEAPEPFAELEKAMPEAAAAAASGEAAGSGGGLMGGLMAAVGGGGIIGLAGRLTGVGLGTGEMTSVGREIFAYAREKAGDQRIEEVAASIPGLSQFI